MPDLTKTRQFFFNAWSLVLLWFIGGVYIPREYATRRFNNLKSLLGWKEKPSVLAVLDPPSIKENVVIITGGTRGIGIAVVKKLLAVNIKVIIGSSASEEKRKDLESVLSCEFPETQVSVWPLDLGSMKSVQSFADRFWESGLPLHVLINNAGIMFEPQQLTDDGFESHLAVNYLGHCLLMRLLLPLLNRRDSKGPETNSRVINVTSCVAAVGTIRLEDFQSQQMYSPYQAYMQSKLAQLMFTYALQGYLNQMQYKVDALSVHPGVVDTGLHHHVWWAPKSINRLYKRPDEGAECILHASLSPELEGKGGSYLEDRQLAKSCRLSYNKSLQDQLWLKTWDLLQPWLPQQGSPRWA